MKVRPDVEANIDCPGCKISNSVKFQIPTPAQASEFRMTCKECDSRFEIIAYIPRERGIKAMSCKMMVTKAAYSPKALKLRPQVIQT